jgi:glycerol uptake facilitator-like aquaporin
MPSGSVWNGLRRAFLSELVGTGLFVAVGLSILTVMFGANSPAIALMSDPAIRRSVTGFLFGTGVHAALYVTAQCAGAILGAIP